MRSAKIIIAPYDPRWPDEYRQIAKAIRRHRHGPAILHHIGSTAVPGLAAKDVIDLQLGVEALHLIDIEHLERLGFEELRGVRDHAPAGLEISDEDLQKRFFRGTRRPANLHVRVSGRFNQRYAVLCRDYLRAHPAVALSYQHIKQTLAGWFPDDKDAYYAIKDPMFDIIMAGAEHWATGSGWTMPQRDD